MDSSELISPEFLDSAEPVVLSPPHLVETGDRLASFLKGQEWSSGAVVFATSGSTGKPKWVVHSRKTLEASAAMVNEHLEVSEEDCWFLALPEFHVGGFGVLARAHEAGCRFGCFEEKWDPEKFVKALSEKEATLTSLVPTQVHDLVQSLLSPPDSLRAVVVGGGGLSEDLGRKARQLGWPVLQSYGMTEAGSQIATESLSNIASDFASVHLPVLSGWEVQVDSSSILELRGPALCLGYVWEEEGGFRWESFGKENWFSTKDVVDLKDGGVLFQKRVGRVVKVRGELVDLDELQDFLRERLGSLCECVLVPLANERVGYLLYPFCAFSDGEEVSLESIFEKIALELPRYCQLEKPFKLAELPRSQLGKVDISALTELLQV